MGQVLMYPKDLFARTSPGSKPAPATPPVTPNPKRRKRRERESGAGHIFLSHGAWFLRYWDVEMTDGKLERKQKCTKLANVEAGYRSKEPPAEIVDIAGRFMARLRAAERKPQSTQLLSEYVEREYLPYTEQHKAVSTHHGYQTHWQMLKPWCEDLRMRDTETCDLQRIFEQMVRQKPYSTETLKHLKSFLSGVFSKAIRDGVMPPGFANPVREVKLPNARDSEETHAYSLEEVQTMLALLPEPSRTAVAVAALTGLSRSEIRGLRWEDLAEVVFDDGEKGLALHIVRKVWNGIEGRPKTRNRKGYVPVIPPLAKVLEQHRLRCGNPATGWIFPNEEGKPACLNNLLNRQILPALEHCAECGKAKGSHNAKTGHAFRLRQPRAWHGWHAFRRGLATNLHRLGVPDKVIQMILRHADVSVTQRCYIKTVDADAAKAMRALEKVLPQSFCAAFVQQNPASTSPN